MRFSICKFVLSIFLTLTTTTVLPQSYTIGILIKNQPNNKIVLGKVQGDNFFATDSAYAQDGLVRFKLDDDASVGMYRINMGKTRYAKLINGSPQFLDFIFNKEEILLETDFNSPDKSVKVITSEENSLWFNFLIEEKELKKRLIEQEKEVNYLWTKDNTDKAISAATEYNFVQLEHDMFLREIIKDCETMFATRMIRTFHEPLFDGYLSKEKREKQFQKEFLKTVDFSDESLINSQAYTDKIFQYLLSYNKSWYTPKQREEAYIKAVDEILPCVNNNKRVYEFIHDYLIHGFEVLKLDGVNSYIKKNYPIK